MNGSNMLLLEIDFRLRDLEVKLEQMAAASMGGDAAAEAESKRQVRESASRLEVKDRGGDLLDMDLDQVFWRLDEVECACVAEEMMRAVRCANYRGLGLVVTLRRNLRGTFKRMGVTP